MAFSPYQHAAEMAEILAPPKPEPAPRNVPGLPSSSRVRGDRLGSTTTQIGGTLPDFVSVVGSPSMKIVKVADGGVAVQLGRQSQYTENLTTQELDKFSKDIGGKIVRLAGDLSHGPYKTNKLAEMGHPYGRGQSSPAGRRRRGLGRIQGSRAGVSNMAVVNEQSGEFAKSWGWDYDRSKGGVVFSLSNSAEHSPYLAFGTKNMKAHGPFTTAFMRYMDQLNEGWRKLAVIGYQRELMLRQMGVSYGGVS